MKFMSEDKKQKNWFRRHWIITSILAIVLLSIIVNVSGDKKVSHANENLLSTLSASNILPQDSEIDRQWLIDPIEPISSNLTGLDEASQRNVRKSEDFSGTSITMKTFVFDSLENSESYFDQEKTRLDVRGVDEWNLGNDCFGIDRSAGLSGKAEGVCIKKNVVVYVSSASSSFFYTSDGKDFMNLMLNKI